MILKKNEEDFQKPVLNLSNIDIICFDQITSNLINEKFSKLIWLNLNGCNLNSLSFLPPIPNLKVLEL